MSIQLELVQTTKTAISIDDDGNSLDRVKITFDDDTAVFFRAEKQSYGGYRLVIDPYETADDLVDEILLLKEDEMTTLCGHENCDDCEHQVEPREFNVFSVITPEQYKQLRVVYLEIDRFDRFVPSIGEELSVWYGWRFNSGGSGGSIKDGHKITNIEIVTLGS